MTTEFGPYNELLERMRQIAMVGSASALLSWDQETYMPPKALAFRAEQMGYFSGWSHRMFIAPEVNRWLEECEQRGFPEGSKPAVNVREWRRIHDRQTNLPTALVVEMEKTRSLARDKWVEAR